MVFAVSGGQLRLIHRSTYIPPNAVRVTDDYTQDYAEVYRTQAEVRVVVEFLARNIGQLALQTFLRLGDDNRRRLTSGPVAEILDKPNPWTTGSRLIRDTVSDKAIYDRALWAKTMLRDAQTGSLRPSLLRIPPALWYLKEGNWLAPETFVVNGSQGVFEVPADQTVYFHGYNPSDARTGTSPIEGLRRALSEAWAASQMREGILRNGARHSGYISRPKDAPKWEDPERIRFKSGWRAQYQGWTATEGGGTPVLEDGMTFVSASQTASELQYVEARKLTREEVASAYFIPPPMIGILDHATFSNITEQHKMLYQDTLGPWLGEFQDEIKLQLIPDYGEPNVYVEFNMMEKLRGSFEEQARTLQSAVGGPWLTRDEARARQNLPPLPDGIGAEIIVPLNVSTGAQQDQQQQDQGQLQETPAAFARPAIGAATP